MRTPGREGLPRGEALIPGRFAGVCLSGTLRAESDFGRRAAMAILVRRIKQTQANPVALTFGAMWAVMLLGMWYIG
jgi:hypothetical protein